MIVKKQFGLIVVVKIYVRINIYFFFSVENERVQIRVYRGPDSSKENFAPWGYFVMQPPDSRVSQRSRYNWHH